MLIISTSNRVKRMIADAMRVHVRDVLLDVSLVDDFGMDSLVFVELVMDIEYELGIKLDDIDLQGVVTVRDLVKLVRVAIGNERKDAA